MLLRVAIFKPANELVQHLLQARADQIDAAYQARPGMHFKDRKKVKVQCLFGCVELTRDYYYLPKENRGHCPADAALGLEMGCTPALARLACQQSAEAHSFEEAEKQLRRTGAIEMEARQLQRLVQAIGPGAQKWPERQTPPEPCDAPILYVSGDGTGVRMRKEELAGRKGKQEDGSAKTRQAYLGCVFTQHQRDEKGRPIRDHNSTTYLSTFGNVGELGLLLRWEARRRGSGTAGKIVLLIDGALGLENQGEINFPDGLQIVDFYHAVQYLKPLLEALHGPACPDLKKRQSRWTKLLLKDGVQTIIDQSRAQSRGQASEAAVKKALHYFEHNVERMQYGTFRKKGYFIGSGVVEAGCKTVIGARCKQSGMFWSEAGAENILALRCIESSRQSDQFWKTRANDHAARNDTLSMSI